MTKSMTRNVVEASELTVVRQVATAANYKADMIQRQMGDLQKQVTGLQDRMNRMELLLQGLVSSQARGPEHAAGRRAPNLRQPEEPRSLPEMVQPGELEMEVTRRIFFKVTDCKSAKLYGNVNYVDERHRHRYEVNPDMVPIFENAGLQFVGKDESSRRMEIIEIPDHRFFVGVQFHLEFKSRPSKPYAPFVGQIAASSGQLDHVQQDSCNGHTIAAEHPLNNGSLKPLVHLNGHAKKHANGVANGTYYADGNGVHGYCFSGQLAEVEALQTYQMQSDGERNEVRDMSNRLEACELSAALCKNSSDASFPVVSKESLLQEMFFSAKTTSGRLHLAKELLKLPPVVLKSFAGSKEGLTTLNSWILDSLGKNATQLLRHCVRLLVRVSTDLLAVHLSGIGKTIKEKVCVHTSQDIRAIARQLVSVWIEVFRKEKDSNGGLKLLRRMPSIESSKTRSKDLQSGKPTLRMPNEALDNHKGAAQHVRSSGSHSPHKTSKKPENKAAKMETMMATRSDGSSLRSQKQHHDLEPKVDNGMVMSEEEAAAFAAEEAARAAAISAAQAYASVEAEISVPRELPKIPSFDTFAMRDHDLDESDTRKKVLSDNLRRLECISEIDSRNGKAKNSLADHANYADVDSSKMTGDNCTQRSYSNEKTCLINIRDNSADSGAVDSRFTRAWVDTDTICIDGVKDPLAIERWQMQAMEADKEFYSRIRIDEEDSISQKQTCRSSVSQVVESKPASEGQSRGIEHIRQGLIDFIATLLMPLYKSKKIDRDDYKTIMREAVTKIIETCTEGEKVMAAHEFLDFKRKSKIQSFVDKLVLTLDMLVEEELTAQVREWICSRDIGTVNVSDVLSNFPDISMEMVEDIMERLLKDGLLSRASKDGYAVNKITNPRTPHIKKELIMHNASPTEGTKNDKGDAQSRELLQRVCECFGKERCERFEDCITWARLAFEDYFANRVKQLTFTFPEDAATSTGALFWFAPKRFPHPLQLLAIDSSHIHFMLAASILRAVSFGIPIPDWAKNMSDLADTVSKVVVPEFEPKRGVKIETDEKATNFSSDSVDDAAVIEDLLTKLETRALSRSDRLVTQWWVQWENLLSEEATWEDADFIKGTFFGVYSQTIKSWFPDQST